MGLTRAKSIERRTLTTITNRGLEIINKLSIHSILLLSKANFSVFRSSRSNLKKGGTMFCIQCWMVLVVVVEDNEEEYKTSARFVI